MTYLFKGPWTVKKLDANHSMIHDSDGLIIVRNMITEPGTASETNAKLVAAAPEMFEELSTVAYILGEYRNLDESVMEESFERIEALFARLGYEL